MPDSFEDLVLGTDLVAILIQLAFVYLVGLLHLYFIVYVVRRGTVVVMSQTRILLESLLASVLGVGFYQVVLRIGPPDGWWWLLAFAGLMLWSVVVNLVILAVDKGRSLRDTVKSEAEPWNCNWPLIRRCAIQSLGYLMIGGAAVSGVGGW